MSFQAATRAKEIAEKKMQDEDFSGALEFALKAQKLFPADESSIKEKYEKLAFLLHPNKNRFAGAKAALNLIKQAHWVLSDQAQRSLYDSKLQTTIQTAKLMQPLPQPNIECSDSCDRESTTIEAVAMKEDDVAKQGFKATSGCYLQRSTRQKKSVNYKENSSQPAAEKWKPSHGGPGSLDVLPSGKPGEASSANRQAEATCCSP
ncbi:hypothetical protein AAC387_Pa03g2190 [Persea americana]